MSIIHKEEKTAFYSLAVLYIFIMMGLIFFGQQLLPGNWKFLAEPIVSPWVASMAIPLIGTWLTKASDDTWLLSKSFWAKQLFFIPPFAVHVFV